MRFMQHLILLLVVASCAKARIIQNFSLRQSKVVIAHRGASGNLPEHTREGLVLAHAYDADYIEVDVVSSKDGVLFALHDLTLGATTDVAIKFPKRARTDGKYYAIDFYAKELETLNVHERVHPETNQAVFPDRFPVNNKSTFELPRLKEMISLIDGLNEARGKKTGLYIEIKDSVFHLKHKIDIVNLLYQELQKNIALEQMKVIIESFNPTDLKRLRNEHKSIYPLVQLIGENSWADSETDYTQMMSEEGMAQVASYADGIGPWIYQLLRPSAEHVIATPLARYARANGLFIHSYTIRSDSLPLFAKSYDFLLELLFLGVQVDGIFTDQPREAVQFLNSYSARNTTIKGK